MNKYILVFAAAFQFWFAVAKDSQPPELFFRGKYISSKADFDDDDFDDCASCGCSASNGLMGFNSLINANFIGIRYINQSYKSTDGVYSNSPWYNESYNTAQVWARIPVTKKLQLAATVPYHSHSRGSATGEEAISGLGDITVLGMYTLYQTQKDSTVFVHTWQGGAGVKMPTGAYNPSIAGSQNPSFQVGTGSWDYLVATEYTVKKDKLGLSSMANYILKTENTQGYQYGNQFNYGTAFFYLFDQGTYTFVPQAGLQGEVYASNKQWGQLISNTSGDVLFSKMGFEVGRNKLSLGANAMLPITQHLTGGNVVANYRWSINLNYSL